MLSGLVIAARSLWCHAPTLPINSLDSSSQNGETSIIPSFSFLRNDHFVNEKEVEKGFKKFPLYR